MYGDEVPSILSHKDTERTAEWFAPIILTKKTINVLNAKSSKIVVFEKINSNLTISGNDG